MQIPKAYSQIICLGLWNCCLRSWKTENFAFSGLYFISLCFQLDFFHIDLHRNIQAQHGML
jgi:hypothetical protein